VVEIDLGKGHVAVIDDEDADLVAGFKWYPMLIVRKYLYAAGWKEMPPGRFFVLLHRLIANAQPGQIVDHIDRDPMNCRKGNLRIVTAHQNCWNAGPKGKGRTSKYKGVFFDKWAQRFVAQLMFNGKRIKIGYYKNEDDAARAYNAKAVELFGSFAYLNPVPGEV
jgi:hypothetical protein